MPLMPARVATVSRTRDRASANSGRPRPAVAPLPGAENFKHQVYAPGAYTGYGAKPIAAVREYMDQEKWKEAEAQVPIVGQVLENVAAAISRAADDLERATRRAQ